MELHSPLLVFVVSINILNFHQRRLVFHYLHDLAESVVVNGLDNISVQKLKELRIGLFLQFWIFGVYSIYLVAHLLNQLSSLIVLHWLLNYLILRLHDVNHSFFHFDINVLVIFCHSVELSFIFDLDSFQLEVFQVTFKDLSCGFHLLLEVICLLVHGYDL